MRLPMLKNQTRDVKKSPFLRITNTRPLKFPLALIDKRAILREVSQGKFQKFPKNSNKYQKQNKLNNVEHLEESQENFFLESISMASTTASNSKFTNKTWSLTGILKNTRNNGQLPVDFKVDSGSCVTAIPENLYSNKLGKLQFTNLRLHGAGQNILKTVGKINVELQYNNRSINVDFLSLKI